MSNPTGPVPPYGTPEYAAWYARQEFGQQPQQLPLFDTEAHQPLQAAPKKKHRIRKVVLASIGVVVIGSVIGGMSGSGGGDKSGSGHHSAAVSTPTHATPTPERSSTTPDADNTAAVTGYPIYAALITAYGYTPLPTSVAAERAAHYCALPEDALYSEMILDAASHPGDSAHAALYGRTIGTLTGAYCPEDSAVVQRVAHRLMALGN